MRRFRWQNSQLSCLINVIALAIIIAAIFTVILPYLSQLGRITDGQ